MAYGVTVVRKRIVIATVASLYRYLLQKKITILLPLFNELSGSANCPIKMVLAILSNDSI